VSVAMKKPNKPAGGYGPGSASAPSGTFLTAPPISEVPEPTNGTLVPLAQKKTQKPMALRDMDPAQQKQERAKATANFLREHCRSDVSEEWKEVDDRKIAKLRGILAALQEENQSTQLLKKESENAEAKRELQATRAGVESRMVVCKDKETIFKKKQLELRRHVEENEKALRELEETIQKGEKKCRDEQAECRKLDEEYFQLQKEIAQLEVVKALEAKRIGQTAMYKQFLEAVVQEPGYDDFEGDIENLMNRHNTLEGGNQELMTLSTDLTKKLDAKREEALRVQGKLQNEHLMISSQLHECQVSLDKHRAESSEMEKKLNQALEEKELKESQVGVIQMAIEQLFTRTVSSCRMKQRKQAMTEAVDIKFAPVRGDKGDARLEEMLRQIIERISDLQEMHRRAKDELRKDTSDLKKDFEEEAVPTIKFAQERIRPD